MCLSSSSSLKPTVNFRSAPLYFSQASSQPPQGSQCLMVTKCDGTPNKNWSFPLLLVYIELKIVFRFISKTSFMCEWEKYCRGSELSKVLVNKCILYVRILYSITMLILLFVCILNTPGRSVWPTYVAAAVTSEFPLCDIKDIFCSVLSDCRKSLAQDIWYQKSIFELKRKGATTLRSSSLMSPTVLSLWINILIKIKTKKNI